MLWGIYSAIYELLVRRCEKGVEIKGDYVESCFISVTLKSWWGRKLLDPTTHISYLGPLYVCDMQYFVKAILFILRRTKVHGVK